MNAESRQRQNLFDTLVTVRGLLDKAMTAVDLEALGPLDGVRADVDMSVLISAVEKSLPNTDRELDFVMSGIWLGREQELVNARRLVDGLITRGVQVRKLYTSELLTSSRSGERLRRDVDRGLNVRIMDRDVAFMTTLDLELALIAVRRSPHRAQFSRVADALGIRVLRSLFNALWDVSVDARLLLQMAEGGWAGQAGGVLKMLGSGYTDDLAATKLGMSVRTYRRHVADIMRKLNATSRFEAGFRAAELGLIRNHASDFGNAAP